MDERKLTELFRDAVTDVPPPSFDQHDVAAESGRQRARHRTAVMGGSALGVALIVGATVLGVALWRGSDAGNLTATAGGAEAPVATGNGRVPPNELPQEDNSQSPRAASGGEQDKSFSAESPEQGGTPTGNAGPQGPGSTSSGCEQAVRELAAALAGELPAAALGTEFRADVFCPAGAVGAAFRVTENGRSGIVSVVVLPAGQRWDGAAAGQPEGTQAREALTADGRQVLVISEPDVSSVEPPYLNDLQRAADGVAAKL